MYKNRTSLVEARVYYQCSDRLDQNMEQRLGRGASGEKNKQCSGKHKIFPGRASLNILDSSFLSLGVSSKFS